ncbi:MULTISPECIES: biliverdin-producing heme oxygenase [Paraburkholderia]|uniref:Heme oxygenase n=1 Tax=Paraburkholderia hospita TaxID=169430 RepID=A0AAN1JCK3_9BURK|nr:biliverdin-producing heme oxygenase [Paraburkholderia hospita]SKC90682.1 Heme oxygenase [Burkholderia sp. CF099]SOE90912.1 Heme oxygenase [Burkholderia sp. YR290]AUT71525.1 heme oxygenase [Paraburkholderia hospita]EIM99473.1 heme oxygenase-like protein [Paraburkholderia hospita]OUL67757.1 heme oxygenase [Paraburkholderia hospita]
MSLPPATLSTDTPDVLAALREATGSRHALIDSAMPLSADAPTLRDYRLHVQLVAAWLAPLEQWLANFDDGPQRALPFVARMPLIVRDLAESSLRTEQIADEPLEQAMPPDVDDAAFRWGVCYVIEGSQLGGTVLYRRLSETLAPHPLRYLSGDGVPPGPRWKSFIDAMRAQVVTPHEIARACEGAKVAFDRLLGLLPETRAA